MMQYSVMFGLTIFIACVGQMLACSCFFPAMQTLYCDSHVVLRGRVTSEDEVKDEWYVRERIYEVEVDKVYRTTRGFNAEENEIVKVHTSGDGGTCGRTMTIGDEYLITGSLRYDKLWISLCGWVERMEDMSEFARRGIEEEFDCSCPIKYERFPFPRPGQKDGGCTLLSSRPFYVPNPEAYCRKNTTTNECGWMAA